MKAKSPNTTNQPGEVPVPQAKPAPAVAASKDRSKEAGEKGPSPHEHEQLTFEAIRALRMWQKVTGNDSRHRAVVDVVKLAVELARLRDTTDPARFLDEAARLLTDAGTALGREQTRPQQEHREQLDEIRAGFADEFRGYQVSFDKLCRPAADNEKIGASGLTATELFSFTNGNDEQVAFQWRVYRAERDFKQLLAKHAKRIYDAKQICSEVDSILRILKEAMEVAERRKRAPKTADELPTGRPVMEISFERKIAVERLGNRSPEGKLPSWGEVAVESLQNHWLPAEWREKFLQIDSPVHGAALVKEYVNGAIPHFVEQLWQRAKAGSLDVVTLYSIYNTRQETYKTRGPNRPKTKVSDI